MKFLQFCTPLLTYFTLNHTLQVPLLLSFGQAPVLHIDNVADGSDVQEFTYGKCYTCDQSLGDRRPFGNNEVNENLSWQWGQLSNETVSVDYL